MSSRCAADAALLMETNQEWIGRIYLRMEEPGAGSRGPGRGRLRGAGLLRATPSASPPLSTNKNKNQLP